jgi:hypothetical protein
MMSFQSLLYLATAVLLLIAPGAFAAEPGVDDTGQLQLVEQDRHSAVFVQPGVDWTRYDSLLLDDATVAFRKNWLRDQNRSRRSLSERVSTADMERIKAELAELFDEVFVAELSGNDHWHLVDTAGPNVLRIRPQIVDLDVYAPDVSSSNYTRSYTDSSGSMTLKLELYDADTGDLLAATADRRDVPRRGYMQWTTSVSNKGDARRIMQKWAQTLSERLEATAGHGSPD